MTIDADLLAILACPECKAPVKMAEVKLVCQNPDCGLRFPIRDGIPIMLKEEAEKPQADHP